MIEAKDKYQGLSSSIIKISVLLDTDLLKDSYEGHMGTDPANSNTDDDNLVDPFEMRTLEDDDTDGLLDYSLLFYSTFVDNLDSDNVEYRWLGDFHYMGNEAYSDFQ